MRRPALLVAIVSVLSVAAAHAQFTLQDSGTTADLRGIVSVGNGNAWASGTHGTVLRTEDGGFVWQGCAVPPGGQDLDFRGIQAFDDQTAIVMSSGKGDLSRVYKTTDGCKSWKLVFTDPDADGFFDALQMNPPGGTSRDYGVLVGDPVDGAFAVFYTVDAGTHWKRMRGAPKANTGEALFAASNQAAAWLGLPYGFALATGGTDGSRLLKFTLCNTDDGDRCKGRYGSAPLAQPSMDTAFQRGWSAHALPFQAGVSSGAFALAQTPVAARKRTDALVSVGGNYQQAMTADHTAAYSLDSGNTWLGASTLPHGYRSSVAYDVPSNTWITVGPNGTDISTDDGRNWRALRPGAGDDPTADRQWNALSLPFVVGPHGRIGRLRDDALPKPSGPRKPR